MCLPDPGSRGTVSGVPIYEYKCSNCGGSFEELIRNAEEAAALACPSCGGAEVRKLLSAFAVVDSSSPACAGEIQGCAGPQMGACPATGCSSN